MRARPDAAAPAAAKMMAPAAAGGERLAAGGQAERELCPGPPQLPDERAAPGSSEGATCRLAASAASCATVGDHSLLRVRCPNRCTHFQW